MGVHGRLWIVSRLPAIKFHRGLMCELVLWRPPLTPLAALDRPYPLNYPSVVRRHLVSVDHN